MRRMLLAGGVLALAAMLVVALSAQFELELESTALLGAALGAVIALVPDGSPSTRLAGFAAGFVVAWVGYVLRATCLPDTTSGRAVATGVVVVLCVAISAVSRQRLPLWTTLLGTAALTGAYELTYAAAPPELASTSVTTATTLLFTIAVGFLAAATFAPVPDADEGTDERHALRKNNDESASVNLDQMMENSK